MGLTQNKFPFDEVKKSRSAIIAGWEGGHHVRWAGTQNSYDNMNVKLQQSALKIEVASNFLLTKADIIFLSIYSFD